MALGGADRSRQVLSSRDAADATGGSPPAPPAAACSFRSLRPEPRRAFHGSHRAALPAEVAAATSADGRTTARTHRFALAERREPRVPCAAATLVLLLLPIAQGHEWGWSPVSAIGCFADVAFALMALVAWFGLRHIQEAQRHAAEAAADRVAVTESEVLPGSR